jgi:predicted pyridoxine 5'-phosphate oxidase superfamily flavin-nucleotide-binding protein
MGTDDRSVTNRPSSDVAFSPSVKQVQTERGSRAAYQRIEAQGGFETEVNEWLRDFLAQVDSAFLATASRDGQPYVQHRGGAKGFLRPLDGHTLAFLDFRGNRQYVTSGNLAENDRVCLLVLDYERRRRVKIWGTARLPPVDDAWLERLSPPGGRAQAEQVLVISVSAWDVNCPQHLPQKLDASEVAEAVARLEQRIAELEEQNRRLRKGV